MGNGELTCKDLIEVLGAYLDDDLAPQTRALFEAHLGECPDCAQYLGGYRRTIHLTKDALDPDGPLPADVPEELVRAVLAVRPRR